MVAHAHSQHAGLHRDISIEPGGRQAQHPGLLEIRTAKIGAHARGGYFQTAQVTIDA
jgi:hypothetical protein